MLADVICGGRALDDATASVASRLERERSLVERFITMFPLPVQAPAPAPASGKRRE